MAKGFHIRIIARLKHGDLREALERLGWNQSKAAKFLKMSAPRFGRLMNLKEIPKRLSLEQEAKLLWMTGKSSVDELWPQSIRSEEFLEKGKTLELSYLIEPRLLATSDFLRLPLNPEEALKKKELNKLIKSIIEKLPPRQKRVIEAYYFEEKTLSAIAKEFRLSIAAVENIRNKALSYLRHPVRARIIKRHI